MIRLRPWQEYALLGLLIGAVLALAYGPDRTHSAWLLGFSGLAFGAYMFVANAGIAWKRVFVLAILVRMLVLSAPVGWTDDHYRYLFDGGVHFLETGSVYDTTPEQAADVGQRLGSEFMPLVNHQDTYTVYPPFAQFVFGMSYGLGSGLDLYEKGQSVREGAILWMRIFILLMETLTIAALLKVLSLMALPRAWVVWYALNPLVILEFAVNLHTEVYMISWCCLAILMIRQRNWLIGGVLLGLACSAKLWPLMFLAFAPNWFGWRKAVAFGTVVLGTFVLSWIPFYTESLVGNISESLKLYFSYFEFNAPIYYSLKAVLPEGWVKGGPLMGILTVLLVSITGILAWKRGWKNPAEGMLWAMAIYLGFASTIHPWYILPLLAFATLTHYRWPFIWAALIIPTYLTYATDPYAQPFWWLWIEYILLAGVIALELMVHSTWAMKYRARIKSERLLPLLPEGARILDIGTGNGALAHALQNAGHRVETVDIVDNCRFPEVKPIVIGSGELPFADDSFDHVLIITVLHHTRDQVAILEEAKRVGKELIVMEDVYSNPIQRSLTYLFDSLINLEFWGHPHSNRSDEEWLTLFDAKGLKLKSRQDLRTLGLFDQTIYQLAEPE